MKNGLTILDSAKHDFAEHSSAWGSCIKCDIGQRAHHHVFARGTLPCEVLFVGEGPGKTEDVTGSPFVGRAGKLLDSWIKHAQGVRPFTWAITNLVLCRPCDCSGGPNRAPYHNEVYRCRPRLLDFLQRIARPQHIVLLGKTAQIYFPTPYGQFSVLHLRHPAYVLRTGGAGCVEDQRELAKLKYFIERKLPCQLS